MDNGNHETANSSEILWIADESRNRTRLHSRSSFAMGEER